MLCSSAATTIGRCRAQLATTSMRRSYSASGSTPAGQHVAAVLEFALWNVTGVDWAFLGYGPDTNGPRLRSCLRLSRQRAESSLSPPA
jgi:hypothetical protein